MKYSHQQTKYIGK